MQHHKNSNRSPSSKERYISTGHRFFVLCLAHDIKFSRSMEKSLKDLKLTKDELGRLDKAFKDPEFCKLFAEYAEELSDPENKRK